MRAVLRSLFLWALTSAACWSQPPQDWRTGVLDGYQLFSVAPRLGTKSKPVDIRMLWDQSIFFRTPRQLEKQGRTYPFVTIVDAAPEQGTFLAVPGGLQYREDGPLVLGDAATGKAIRTLPVSGSSISAAFVPPDGRRIVAFWRDPDGQLRTATFDSSTARMIGELSQHPPDSRGFIFVNTPAGIRFVAEGPDKGPKYQFASLESRQEASPVTLPAGDFTILDLRGSTILLESRASSITVSSWDWTHPETRPVAIQSREYSGAAVHSVLADGGLRVMQWTDPGGAVTFYDSSTGRVSGKLNTGGPVRAYAIDPTGKSVVIAVNRRLMFVDPSSARILSRSPNLASLADDLSLFWFRSRP